MDEGFTGQLLTVDLSCSKYALEHYDEDLATRSLGGFGANNFLFREFCSPGTDPLSERNVVILGAGPFVGTPVPGASRVMATSRVPLTGSVASASGGMGLGANMKWSGLDHIVIAGRAPRPTLLLIKDGDVEFLSAESLWGKDIPATTRALWNAYPDSSVLAIGPAGENEVSLAISLIDNCSTLGRGGLGAVLGSKNLKALVIKGTGGVDVNDPGRLRELVRGLFERLEGWPNRESAITLGMIGAWPMYAAQLIPAGSSEDDLEEAIERFGPAGYLPLKKARISCPSCFLADKDELVLPEGDAVYSTSFLNAAILGCGFSMGSAGEAASTLALLDRLGLDFFTLSNEANCLLDLAGANAIDERDAEGLPLRRCGELIRELACRVSGASGKIGNALSRGWEGLLELFGADARRFTILVRGQDCLYDPRVSGLGTMEFEQVVSPRGPTSASAGSPTYVPGLSIDRLERLTRRMGAGDAAVERIFAPPQGFNVGRLTRYSEDWFSLFSSLGICNRYQVNRFYNPVLIRDLLAAVTGIDIDAAEMMQRASASWERYRALNAREGLGTGEDRFPEAWLSENVAWGRAGRLTDYFGRDIGRPELDKLLADYYDERSRPYG